jgi:hypothetical protein
MSCLFNRRNPGSLNCAEVSTEGTGTVERGRIWSDLWTGDELHRIPGSSGDDSRSVHGRRTCQKIYRHEDVGANLGLDKNA